MNSHPELLWSLLAMLAWMGALVVLMLWFIVRQRH